MANGSIALFLFGLFLVDGAVLAAIEMGSADESPFAVAARSPQKRQKDVPADMPRDEGFSFCQTRYADQDVVPSKAAITYLDPTVDRNVSVDEIRSWFGEIPTHAVDVYALEHKNGRRRIAFEVAASKWSGWAEVAGDSQGRELCARLRAALLSRKIGRPDRPADTDRSRYDFEFVYSRRTKLWRNYTFLGTLDQFLSPETLTYYRSWLDNSDELE